jgi:hypothetical protein
VPIKLEREWAVPAADRKTTDRADYTMDVITNVDVTVQTERLARITKTSTDNIAPGESGEYDSDWFETGDYNKLVGHVFADQPLTVYLDQSDDGETLRVQTTKTYLASLYDGGFSIEVVAPYFRVRVRNTGNSTTTVFVAWTRLSTGA